MLFFDQKLMKLWKKKCWRQQGLMVLWPGPALSVIIHLTKQQTCTNILRENTWSSPFIVKFVIVNSRAEMIWMFIGSPCIDLTFNKRLFKIYSIFCPAKCPKWLMRLVVKLGYAPIVVMSLRGKTTWRNMWKENTYIYLSFVNFVALRLNPELI